MLRRKTIIVLVITLMVTTMVTAFSYLYISQILRLRIANANETATSLTHQLAYAVSNAVPDFSSTSVDTNNTGAVRRAFSDYVQTDVLKSEVQARLMKAAYISIALMFASLFLAAGISNLALGPLKQINMNLDSVNAGTSASLPADESEHDEYGLVSLKIANLGR